MDRIVDRTRSLTYLADGHLVAVGVEGTEQTQQA